MIALLLAEIWEKDFIICNLIALLLSQKWMKMSNIHILSWVTHKKYHYQQVLDI